MGLAHDPEIGYQIATETLQFAASPFDFAGGLILDRFLQTTPDPSLQTKLLLVNSSVHKSTEYWIWRWYLARQGIPTAMVYLSLNEHSFADSARALDAYISRHELHPAAIAGISSGALTSLLYLRDGG